MDHHKNPLKETTAAAVLDRFAQLSEQVSATKDVKSLKSFEPLLKDIADVCFSYPVVNLLPF